MKQFKAESKKLLDMMINSIYTNKDIFLRELISNASDAIDKRRFMSLTDSSLSADFKITLKADKDAKTLSVEDNGVGMSKDELETNLGTIASSGTFKFRQDNKSDEEDALIGRFGVGFYSAFMVASKVEVVTRSVSDTQGWKWTSSGVEGYDIKPCEKAEAGTTVTLTVKENDEDCKYADYLSEFKLRSLVKTYSDYIRYPIVMDVTKSRKEDGGEGYTEYTETETLNTMTPIWKKPKKQVKKEDYDAFYRSRFHDWRAPRRVMQVNIEGNVNYTALLFVPDKIPSNYYSKDYEKGLALYSSGVLIKEKCADLLPDWLGFVRGIVDSPDLSLNVSREMLQQDRQLSFIATSLRKKIVDNLKKWLKEERGEYEKFFAEFGEGIKYGVYENFGEKKDELKDLVLLASSTQNKPVLIGEYVSRMKEGQEGIYYACGDSVEKTDALPQLEKLKDEGTEILYCVQRVDEFCLIALNEYGGKKFINALKAESGAEEKSDAGETKELLEKVKTALGGKVNKVRMSSRMKTHAVCLTADGEISLEMERVFKANGQEIKADRVLELNPEHALVKKLAALGDEKAFGDLAATLYDEASLIALGEVDDAAAFVTRINALMK